MKHWIWAPVVVSLLAFGYTYKLKLDIDVRATELKGFMQQQPVPRRTRSERLAVWGSVQRELLESVKDLDTHMSEWRRIYEILLENDPSLARRYEARQYAQHGYHCVHWEGKSGEPMRCVSGWQKDRPHPMDPNRWEETR